MINNLFFFRYLDTVQVVCNSFLKAQGYPKETLIDLNRPAESISALANAVFKKQFDLSVNSETYVRPAILYLQVGHSNKDRKSVNIRLEVPV